jgi:hypothetical protein
MGASKYGNRRITVDGNSFASKREAARYGELRLLQGIGEIENLTLQPRFPLKVNGKLVCTYVADFLYGKTGDATSLVVEDVKGYRTEVYKIKAKLFEALHGFPIREV